MKHRLTRVSAGILTVGVLSTFTLSSASYADTPAPPATADAVALSVATILAISHTHAEAGDASGTATANALEVGGTPPATNFGGTITGDGEGHGALVDTGGTGLDPLGRLQLTPWHAKVASTDGSRTAESQAALLALTLVSADVLTLTVLSSSSQAKWTKSASTGTAMSDGAILNAGGASGLHVDLLHSEADSSGKGSSYVVDINGNKVLTNSDANSACVVSIPGVLALSCLTATGGAGQSAAEVLGAILVPDANGGGAVKGDAIAAKGSGGSGVQVSAAPPVTPPAPPPTLVLGATLPRTGVAAGLLTLVGGLLASLGFMMAVAARRRTVIA